jgi:hypothetical protein
MRKLRWYDWVGGLALWSGATFAAAVHLESSGMPDELALTFPLVIWGVGVVGARVWWLRRAPEDTGAALPRREGLTTGEMTAQRLADMEARIYELEERLELSERLLMEATLQPRLPRVREETPV